MLFANRPLLYVSTEGETVIKECRSEEVKKDTEKKKKGKKTHNKEKGNQEEFEAMKKRTKKMLFGVLAAMAAAMIGAVVYKLRH